MFAAALPAGKAAFAAPIEPFEATYEVENDYITGGIATLTLAADQENGYLFSLQSKPTGIFKWTNNGRIREQARLASLEPPFLASEYQYLDKGRPERSYSIRFDRTAGSFALSRENSMSVFPMPADVIDRLSVTLVLLDRVRSDPEFKRLEIEALDGKQVETVAYSNRGVERLRTDIGEFDAVRVLKDRVNSTRETIIWLAAIGESATVLPVKIEQFKKGKLSLRLKISKVRMLD